MRENTSEIAIPLTMDVVQGKEDLDEGLDESLCQDDTVTATILFNPITVQIVQETVHVPCPDVTVTAINR